MKSVICYLSKSDQTTIDNLKKSLNLLYKNYKFIELSDVILFVESDFSKENIIFFESHYKNLKCKIIELNQSEHFKININEIVFEDKCDYSIGYRHMCQFFFSEIFNYIKEYDWFMRLDTDSYIESKIQYNLFEYLNNNNKVYGYIAEIPEWEPVVKNIDEFFLSYIIENKLKTEFTYKFFEDGKYNLRQIYNNFEIINLKYYLNNELIKKISYDINKSGNIYKKRWRDAPLRSILLSITTPIELLHKFNNFDYFHVWYRRKNGEEICFYEGYQLELFNKWKCEGWLS